MIIDVFSKYGWIVPLKDKKGESVAEAFKTILKEGRKPQYLWVDKGKEYYNKHVKDLLEKNGIHMYSTENEEKSSVVERWNRTIKSKMWKQFTVQGNTIYLDMLAEILKKYNNTKDSSIKMTPTEASNKKNEGTVYFNLYGDMEISKQKPKFKIGDKVRISKYKRNVFDKGYTPNWTEEVFTVDKIQYTNPITYKIKDLNDETIEGSFYEPELLKVKQDVFRIDKVIRRDHKKKQALVKWKGYGDEFNSWIPMKDLINVWKWYKRKLSNIYCINQYSICCIFAVLMMAKNIIVSGYLHFLLWTYLDPFLIILSQFWHLYSFFCHFFICSVLCFFLSSSDIFGRIYIFADLL